MFAGGLILGITLLLLAAWLQWSERQGWPGDADDSELDRNYLMRRRRGRSRVHLLLGGCGGLILIATVAGPASSLVWIGCWMLVMVTLLTVVVLAAFDALRTQRYHARKLPEIRRQTLGK